MKLPLAPPPVEAKPFDVVGFGENSLDLLAVVAGHPAPNSKHQLESLEEQPGGVIATALVACARQGWRARYVGTFGSDATGAAVEDALRREHVDVSMARHIAGRNRRAVITVDRLTGHRTVLEKRDQSLAWQARAEDAGVMTSGRVLIVDASDLGASTMATRAAQAAAIPTVVDIDRCATGVEALLGQIDVLIVEESFPRAYTGLATIGDALRNLAAEFQPALAVATLGDEGSLAICRGTEIRTPAWRVPVVDTTGAGDGFRGGFIAGWLRYGGGAEVETLLAYANAVAALNCTRLGAYAGLPTQAEVDALVTGAVRDRSN